MSCLVTRLIFITTLIIGLAGFGCSLRIDTEPKAYNDMTKELNISCIPDGPAHWAKSIVSLQIMRQNEHTIAVINMKQEIKMGVGSQDNMKVYGHVDTADASKSHLTLTIIKPNRQDAGVYVCLMFYTDENFKIIEERVTGNVTFQDPDFTDIIVELSRKMSNLTTTLQKQHNTIQTLEKQHTTSNDAEFKQNQDIDILADKINEQNITIIKQNKKIEEIMKDNNKKQQQLDILLDFIKHQNKTNQKYESQLHDMAKKIACPYDWTYYQHDDTCIKVFGNGDNSKHLSWSKAREACKMFGDGDLVSIRDEAKNNFVCKMVVGSPFAWIGIKNHSPDSYDLKYVDGSQLGTNYQPWYPGEPNQARDKGDKCVEISTTTSQPGEWFDFFCSQTRAYVCSMTSTFGVL